MEREASSKEKKAPGFYSISLQRGYDFSDLDNDFVSIFGSFSLLSWLAPSCRIRILKMTKKDDLDCTVALYPIVDENTLSFPLRNFANNSKRISTSYDESLQNLWLYTMSKNFDTKKISYLVSLEQKVEPTNNNFVQVTFKKLVDSIQIEINDKNQFFIQNFKIPAIEKPKLQKRLPGNNILEYFYIEPENVRNKPIPEDHFNLAFQGGGAKGVAYIGAYKAIKQNYPDLKIRSIIGSSAGGMLALAMSAGASVKELEALCEDMNQIPSDRLVKTVDDIPAIQARINEDKLKIRNFLHSIGIVYNQLFDYLFPLLFTQQNIDKLFSAVCEGNASFTEMFKLQVTERKEESGFLFWKKQAIQRKREMLVNYFGLVLGKVLSGKKIQEISISILQKFLVRKFDEDEKNTVEILGLQNILPPTSPEERKAMIKKLATELTMDKFYKLSGQVEFTCTSVDLTDKILRFFNHKTTPKLPVHKAVELTGSFPVAFEAQIWHHSWGPYIIHYKRFRREINLTNHQFTDGGLLANFPMMYLDNEEMRPMYFAHRSTTKTETSGQTTTFGFGLQDLSKPDPALRQKQGKLFSSFFQSLNNSLPSKLKLLNFLRTTRPDDQQIPANQVMSMKEIPLLKLGLDILETLAVAHNNLVFQCFYHMIYRISDQYTLKQIMTDANNQVIQNKIHAVTPIVNRLRATFNSEKYTLQGGLAQLYALQTYYSENPTNIQRIRRVKKILKSLVNRVGQYIQKEKKSKVISNDIINIQQETLQLRENLNLIDKWKVFSWSNQNRYDSEWLKKYLQQVIKLFQDQIKKDSDGKESFLKKFLQDFKQCQNVKLTQIAELVQRFNPPNIPPNMSLLITRGGIDWIAYKKKIIELLLDYIVDIADRTDPEFLQFEREIRNININELMIKLQFELEGSGIRNYINMRLQDRQSKSNNNIHLVFDGSGISWGFYLEAFKILKEFLFRINNNISLRLYRKLRKLILADPRISNMENAEMFKQPEIIEEIEYFISKHIFEKPQEIVLDNGTKIPIDKRLMDELAYQVEIEVSKKINIYAITCSNYHAFLGFLLSLGLDPKTIGVYMDLLKKMFVIEKGINEEFDKMNWAVPFQAKVRELQNQLWRNRYDLFDGFEKINYGNKVFEKDIERIKGQFDNSKELILDGFEQVLSYMAQINLKSVDEDKQAEYIGKMMSLKFGRIDYQQHNTKLSEGTQEFIKFLLNHFGQQIRYVILEFAYSSNTLEMVQLFEDPEKIEMFWKGVIIEKLITSLNLKREVQGILNRLNLPKNITLKEFYDACPNRWLFTVTAVDISSKKIVFINKNTYPFMPVWVALVITSSLPTLFTPVKARSEWLQSFDLNSNERNLSLFFRDEQENTGPSTFVSGNLIASIPIDFLTSHKCNKLYFKLADCTFINFSLERKPFQQQAGITFNRHFFSAWQGFKYGLSSFFSIFKSKKQWTMSLSSIQHKFNVISTFINCHDNLIFDLYYEDLLKLPIYLSTLDFHKIKPLLASTIQQAYFTTQEKFSKYKKKEFNEDGDLIDEKQTFIRFERLRKKKEKEVLGELKDEERIVIRFISKSLFNKEVRSKYKVYATPLKNNDYHKFAVIEGEILSLPSDSTGVEIVFNFVNKNQETDKLFQTTYRIDFTNIRQKLNDTFQPVYQIYYNRPINSSVYPANILSDTRVDTAIHSKSILSFQKNGLYCLQCGDSLNPTLTSQFQKIFTQKPIPHTHCLQCQLPSQTTNIRFECRKCHSHYCMRCLKSNIMQLTYNRLACLRGHLFHYDENQMRREFELCDVCGMVGSAVYRDGRCGIVVCCGCCQEFVENS